MAVKKGNFRSTARIYFDYKKNGYIQIMISLFVMLVSNGCDAITKLKKLDMMGEYELPEGYKPKIEVIVNPERRR